MGSGSPALSPVVTHALSQVVSQAVWGGGEVGGGDGVIVVGVGWVVGEGGEAGVVSIIVVVLVILVVVVVVVG